MKKPLAVATLAVATLGTAGLVARRYLTVRDALTLVPGELRSPLLLFLASDTTAKSLPRARLVYGKVRTPAGRGVRVQGRLVGTPPVPVTVTTPRGTRLRPGVLYIHGGGMILGSPQAEAVGSSRTARDLDAVVVSPDYRLAPEHPYPAAIDDCMTALRWMVTNADELGIDPGRLAVTGSSAGGGLSAAVAQRAYDEGIALRAQALIYPMLDDRSALRDHGDRGRFMWTPASNLFGWTAYLGREPRLEDAPEYAAASRRENLSGLAPAWVGVGDLDLLYDESVDYAKRLKAAGVPCELVTVPGMYHGADGVALKAPAMRAFRKSVTEFLLQHL
jgi:acetyl esterase/lipase